MNYYGNKKIQLDDYIVVKILQIGDSGITCELLEYKNKEAFLVMGEKTRKKSNSIKNILKIGQIEVCNVIRIDEDKGYIDLTKRNLNEKEKSKTLLKYENAKKVDGIINHISEILSITIEFLYDNIVYPLLNIYGCVYYAFSEIYKNNQILSDNCLINIDIKNKLLDIINIKFEIKPSIIRADFGLACLNYNGINIIKEILLKAESLKSDNINLSIKYSSDGTKDYCVYIISTITKNENEAIELIKKSLDMIKSEIEENNGFFIIKREPIIISKSEINFKEHIKEEINEEFEFDYE
jgi:translation initiation factor 2 subunit 1